MDPPNGAPSDAGAASTAASDEPVPMEISAENDAIPAKSLVAFETLDRSSPELWPTEPVMAASQLPLDRRIATPPPLEARIKEISEQDEEGIMRELSLLPAPEMLKRIKDLENLAYQLGLEESYEITKGKLFNILGASSTAK